jgi:hypothetical protein
MAENQQSPNQAGAGQGENSDIASKHFNTVTYSYCNPIKPFQLTVKLS